MFLPSTTLFGDRHGSASRPSTGDARPGGYPRSNENSYLHNHLDLNDWHFGIRHDTFDTQAGIIDPPKVERVALENAAAIASLLLTIEALITDIPEDKPAAAPAMPHGAM